MGAVVRLSRWDVETAPLESDPEGPLRRLTAVVDGNVSGRVLHKAGQSLNAVILTCADIVRNHSHRSFWTPAGTPNGPLPPTDLIDSARQDILSKLTLVITCAETVIHEIERGPTKGRAPHLPY